MAQTLTADAALIDRATEDLNRVRQEIGKVIVGQTEVIDGVLICLIAGGHVLLVGVPVLVKTTLLRTLSRVLELRYSRIQFTPDLMPGDIVGSMVMESDDHGHKNLRFQPGPIFANLVLADEINRATPKTQSALLEAMQERTVTSGTSTYSLDMPFLVMATQNPIEMEGTYPLPEAQLDRFLMKVLVSFPSRTDLSKIVDFTTKRDEVELRQVLDKTGIADLKAICKQVVVAPHVQELAIDLVMATQPGMANSPEITNRYIRYGSSPRGAQALIECGRVLAVMRHRMHLSVDDLVTVAPAVLRHRMILNFDAHADGESTETILTKLLERTLPKA
jgi:MoxR-like ATPase